MGKYVNSSNEIIMNAVQRIKVYKLKFVIGYYKWYTEKVSDEKISGKKYPQNVFTLQY